MAVSPLMIVLRRSFLQRSLAQRRCRAPSGRVQLFVQTLQAAACPCSFYCTQKLYRNEVTVQYRDGLPVVSVPLPSRQESCEFTLKPVSHTVADFLSFVKEEDGGIERVAVYKEDGSRIAKSTPVEIFLRSQFTMFINEHQYVVSPPETRPLLSEDAATLSDVKQLISQLYSTLNIEDHQLEKEQEIRQRLEDLKLQIAPLEQVKLELEDKASRNTNYLSWFGLGLMSLQFGVLARLTWWEYSWDIMEPVTYFVTYGTSMAMFAYYLLTKQEYLFPDAHDRAFLLRFHKLAQKRKLDVQHYNQLRQHIAQAEEDLQRLRDPLQLQLPIKEIKRRSAEEQ